MSYFAAPIDNITVTGNNWLKHGDILQLQVKCNGSPPFLYCVNYYYWPHNITNNETCEVEYSKDVCDFSVVRYYNEPKEYSIAIIVKNQVTKLVSPVTVNVYKGKVEDQSCLENTLTSIQALGRPDASLKILQACFKLKSSTSIKETYSCYR